MLQAQTFAKVAGIIQAVVGVAGAAAPSVAPGLGQLLGAQAGGAGFNVLSGAILSYLGFKGTAASQRTGAQTLGAINVVVGLLGALGVTQIAGIPLNEGTVAIVINLIVGVWGLLAGFMKKK